jgi:hypothetical protein
MSRKTVSNPVKRLCWFFAKIVSLKRLHETPETLFLCRRKIPRQIEEEKLKRTPWERLLKTFLPGCVSFHYFLYRERLSVFASRIGSITLGI